MDVRVLAWWLFLGQIISVFFITLVLIRQVGLFKLRVQKELIVYRRILFLLAVTVFLGNVIPMVIDTVTILGLVQRSANHVNPVGLIYAASNTWRDVSSSLLIWFLYRMAAKIRLLVSEH